uniref:Peptidase S53 domain-containing protein n=1 Tax=Clytia hemisphaerica TaxID=252671 RepID=A0A7M5UVS3_9CNID
FAAYYISLNCLVLLVFSPYITGVGGTGFSNTLTVGPEFAYEISGGGFSNVFDQPKYQTDAVAAYMHTEGVPPKDLRNKTGHAYPGIAALCRHFWVVNNRVPVPGVTGTSASTPSVGGTISMVNEHRLNANKPVMGFLNPFIYKNPQAFYDVTSGCNEGCLTHDKGFCATEGFDPVTGYGSPNFPDLVKAAMAVFKH